MAAVATFSHTGAELLAAAFVNAAIGDAGLVSDESVAEGGAPHWKLSVAAFDGPAGDRPAWLGIGMDSLDVSPWAGHRDLYTPFSPDISTTEDLVNGYINGITGAWWITVNGLLRLCGSRIRRFPADLHDGIFPRYVVLEFPAGGNPQWLGVFHGGAGYSPASFIRVNQSFFSPIWRPANDADRPFGVAPGELLPGSMAPTLAPLFPVVGYDGPVLPVFFMGDCLDVMAATAGFDPAVSPIPGWSVFATREGGGPFFAVPSGA